MLDWIKNLHRRGNPSPPDEFEMSSQDAELTEWGYEMPDPTPMAPPIGYVKQPSMVEHIRAMVRSEQLRVHAESLGAETFEESDDFDVGDDYDTALPSTAYEAVFDPTPPPDGPLATPPADTSGGSPQGVAEPRTGAPLPSSAAPSSPSTPAAPPVSTSG